MLLTPDQVGNVRLSFYKGAGGAAEIDRVTNYYPFGLEFNENIVPVNSMTQNYRYSTQGQEKQEDTKWSSFKWRNYDPTIGRFFNVDPLSEKYAYQSHYNFSENRVVDGRELEGLEFVPTRVFRVVPPSAATGKTAGYGEGITEEVKANAINNYNGIQRIVSTNLNNSVAVIYAISKLGLGLTNRILNSEGDSKTNNDSEGENKKVRNPHGAKGKPDHQAKVKELEEKAKAENPDKDVVTERKIKNEGSNRRPDVQVVDPKTQKTEKIYEAERKPNSTRNKNREAEYEKLKIPNETHPLSNEYKRHEL